MKAARPTAGVLSFIAAGFFFYTTAIISFFSAPEWWVKLVIVGLFEVPAVGFFALGAWCWGRNVLQSLGIVLLSAAGMTALVVFSFVTMLNTPEYAKRLPPETTQRFSAVWTGAICLGGYVVIGLALLFAARRNSQRTNVA